MSITSFMLAHDLFPNTEESDDSFQESSNTETQGTSYWLTNFAIFLLCCIIVSEEDSSEKLSIPDSSLDPSLYPLQKAECASEISSGTTPLKSSGTTPLNKFSSIASEDNSSDILQFTGADVVGGMEASIPMLELHFPHASPHSITRKRSHSKKRDDSKKLASCTTLDCDSCKISTDETPVQKSIDEIGIAPTLPDLESPKDTNTPRLPSKEKVFSSENNKTTHAHTLLSTGL